MKTKKQELREQILRLREELKTANSELGKYKQKEQEEKLNAILEQLQQEFGFCIDWEMSRDECRFDCRIEQKITLRRRI